MNKIKGNASMVVGTKEPTTNALRMWSSHLRGRCCFITILIKMNSNKNENSLTAENSAVQAALVHETDTGDTERLGITVSKETFAYLKCLQQLDTLWGCVYEALELTYSWETADKIMNDEYHEKSCAVRDMINEYLCISIGENVNCKTGITKI